MTEAAFLGLPEPPATNAQTNAAKRSRFAYVGLRKKYCKKFDARIGRPPEAFGLGFPWQQWGIVSADLRLHTLRDPLELAASLKWPVDRLVELGFLVDDSVRHLVGEIPRPSQSIDRKNRGLDLVIYRVDG